MNPKKSKHVGNDSLERRGQEYNRFGPAKIRRLELSRPGQPSSLPGFRTAMKAFSTLMNGCNLSDVFEYNRAPVVPHVVIDQAAYQAASKDELTKMLFETAIKTRMSERTKQEGRIVEELKTLYVILWDQLGEEIQNIVTRDVQYAQKEMERDVVWLWTTVVNICQGGAESTAAANTASAVISFIEIKQQRI